MMNYYQQTILEDIKTMFDQKWEIKSIHYYKTTQFKFECAQPKIPFPNIKRYNGKENLWDEIDFFFFLVWKLHKSVEDSMIILNV